MNEADALVALRLGLLGILLLFVLITAATMRGALQTPRIRQVAQVRQGGGRRFVVLVPAGSGLRPGDAFTVAGEMTIGRDATNGIVIADSSVSGVHARIAAGNRGWRLTDLDSTNGTLVNGAQIDGRGTPVRPGDTLEFGSVVVRFE